MFFVFWPVTDFFSHRCLTMTIRAQFNDCHCCNGAQHCSKKILKKFTCFDYLQSNNFLPRTSSDAMNHLTTSSAACSKGRISTQTKQKDAGATQITLRTGILLPLLLRSTYRSDHSYARDGRVFSQLSLPLFPRNDAQLAEAITLLPVLDMEHSFYMPISALPGLFSRLVQVPLYQQPNTLGWAGLDSQLPTFTRSAEETIDFSDSLVSYTSFRTFFLSLSSHLSSTT